VQRGRISRSGGQKIWVTQRVGTATFVQVKLWEPSQTGEAKQQSVAMN